VMSSERQRPEGAKRSRGALDREGGLLAFATRWMPGSHEGLVTIANTEPACTRVLGDPSPFVRMILFRRVAGLP
jgi:hypothetical protein